jgi:hypothetical protein
MLLDHSSSINRDSSRERSSHVGIALHHSLLVLRIGKVCRRGEETKINWVVQQLGSGRPLIHPSTGDWDLHLEIFPPTAFHTLGTSGVIPEQYEGSSLNA